MNVATLLAGGSALCFGLGLIASRIGLEHLGARAGAAVSVPTAALLFVLVAPLAVEARVPNLHAALLFAVVGLFFPALVTLLTFRSNVEVGPMVTGSIAGTSPLFALLGAWLFVGEAVPARAALACLGVAAGVAALSWQPRSVPRGFALHALAWAGAAAALRGLSQALAKVGLALWPDPFAAAALSYLVSSAVVLGTHRAGGGTAWPWRAPGAGWFMLTGTLNGLAVLLMYVAFGHAPVSAVAPVVASYPLVTALVAWAVLRQERPTLPRAAGVGLIVASVVYLVAAPAR